MEDNDNTKEKLFITFHSKEEIESFVAFCCNYDDAIDIKVGKQVTDAKSIMGMLLMPLTEALEIIYECYDEINDYSDFKELAVSKSDIGVDK